MRFFAKGSYELLPNVSAMFELGARKHIENVANFM